MNKQQLQKQLKEELEKEGFAVKLLDKWPARATYYKQDGEPMPNLPADPYSMERYKKKGFSLVPPASHVQVADLSIKTRVRRKSREIVNDITDDGKIVQVPIDEYKESLKETG